MKGKVVLIVEDDAAVAEMMERYLQMDQFRVQIVSDGHRAMEVFQKIAPLGVILDLQLPGKNGMELCREFRMRSNVPILIISARSREQDILQGLEAGADDYLTKPFRMREVVARLKASLRRAWRPEYQQENIMVGDVLMELKEKRVWVRNQEVELTPTEFRLLEVFMEHAGQVLSRQQLIEHIHGYLYDGLERTLDSHIKNLRLKLEKDPKKPEYIRTVFREGYQLNRLES